MKANPPKSIKLFLLLSAIFIFACNPVEPEKVDKVDPLEFTWTTDTLAYPDSYQTYLYRIWGASSDDVYAVGHNERGYGKMFHFEGTLWEPVELHAGHGGPIAGAIGIDDITGFGSNQIWAVGYRFFRNFATSTRTDSAMILYFDGVEWSEPYTIHDVKLTAIGGRNADDFWVGGLDGIIYHFDGTGFEPDSIPVSLVSGTYFQFRQFLAQENSNGYALLRAPISPISYEMKVLEYKADRWRVLDSFVGLSMIDLWLSPQNNLYGTGMVGFYRWEDGVRATLMDSIALSNIAGTEEDDFYLIGWDPVTLIRNAVWHYNGSSYRRLTLPIDENIRLLDLWTEGTEVFLLGATITSDGRQVTTITHGR